MAVNMFTIVSVVSGALNKVTLMQSGPTSLAVQTRIWDAGSDPDNPADHNTAITLSNCMASPDGMVLSADAAGMLWLKPHTMIKLAAAATTPPTYSSEIVVTGASFENSDTIAAISAAGYAGAIAFIKACGFPPIA
jgi:hypothetical protein